MWPFKNKEPEIDYEEILESERWKQIKDLNDRFPKGSTFLYLGVSCCVTKTYTPFTDYRFVPCLGAIPLLRYRPLLIADYVDKNGVIREVSIQYSEAMKL